MLESGYNSFGSKKHYHDTHPVKTGKHECRNIAAGTLPLYFGTRAYLFSPDEGSCYVTSTRKIVATWLHLMELLFKVLFNHT